MLANIYESIAQRSRKVIELDVGMAASIKSRRYTSAISAEHALARNWRASTFINNVS
jgi:hypothetical protein